MKTLTFMVTAIILLCAISFSGCEKDDKKDYSLLFKNTVWTGGFNYTGALEQPVSIEFKESGQLTWYELAGESTGSWHLENGRLTVSFPGGTGFNAAISSDHQLTHIENQSANNWAMVTGALNEVAEESLDQTTWTGANIKLNFKAGNKVDMELGPTGSTKYSDISYVHKGKSVYFDVVDGDYRWFIVRNSNSTFMGVNMFDPDPAVYPFQVSRN